MNCHYPTVRFVAFEDRLGRGIFVPDPSLRGRYAFTDRSVALVACPHCHSIPGELCKGMHGYWAGTHSDRRNAARPRMRQCLPQNDILEGEHETFDWEAYQ